MKRKLACVATGLILVGLTGIAQAQCNCREVFYTEGPSYKWNTKQITIVNKSVECIDAESFYTEGMRVTPCVKGQKTIVITDTTTADFFTEGISDKELKNLRHLKNINDIVPAAGQ